MKRIFWMLATTALLPAGSSQAQNTGAAPYDVVFDITNADTINQQQVVREVALIKKSHPDARLEVVVYGRGLDLLLRDNSAVAQDIRELVRQPGVTFKACHISMERHRITASQLIAGVETVPDGIYEIITRQREGWGYIKIAQ